MSLSFSWASFEALAAWVVPMIISAVVPGGALIGPLITGAITTVETVLGNGTGAVKKAAVLSTVGTTVAALNAATGTTILDPVTTETQVGTGIDLAISVINSIQKAATSTPATPVA